MPEPDPPKLEYAIEPPAAWHQRRPTRRVLFGILHVILIVSIGMTFWIVGRTAWNTIKEYWVSRPLQQWCMDYSPPAGQIVMDDDPAEFSNLLKSDPGYSLQAGSGLPQAVEYIPAKWQQFLSHVNYHGCAPPLYDADALLYLHGRRTPGGQDRIASCFLLGIDADGGASFWTQTFTMAKLGTASTCCNRRDFPDQTDLLSRIENPANISKSSPVNPIRRTVPISRSPMPSTARQEPSTAGLRTMKR